MTPPPSACVTAEADVQIQHPEPREAFQAELKPLLPQLYRFCLALCRDAQEAEDVLQEGLVRAYLARDGFQGRSSRVTWLRTILRHQFIETRRAMSRRRSLWNELLSGCSSVLGSLFTGGPEQPSPEQSSVRAQERSLLHDSLHQLPDVFRAVVFLCDVEELSYQEVAQTLQLPVGTVKSRHSRGRLQLGRIYRSKEARSLEGALALDAEAGHE